MPERFLQKGDYEKDFAHLRPQILKRTRRIINPLDDNPRMSESGDLLLIDQLLRTEKVEYPLRFSNGFSREAGVGDFLTMRVLSQEEVGSFVETTSKRGVELLEDLFKEYQQVADTIMFIKEVSIFSGEDPPSAVINLLAAQPRFRHTFHFMQYIVQKQSEWSPDRFRFNEDNLALFAANVGFGQAFVIDEAKLHHDKKKKDAYRDEVLSFIKKEYVRHGFQPMIDYIEAQKVAEYLTRVEMKQKSKTPKNN